MWATIQELIVSVNTTALLAINPSECYATTNFLERDSWSILHGEVLLHTALLGTVPLLELSRIVPLR